MPLDYTALPHAKERIDEEEDDGADEARARAHARARTP
jgi:hypothetical protein